MAAGVAQKRTLSVLAQASHLRAVEFEVARAQISSFREVGIQIETHALPVFPVPARAAPPASIGAWVCDRRRFAPAATQHRPRQVRALPLAVVG